MKIFFLTALTLAFVVSCSNDYDFDNKTAENDLTEKTFTLAREEFEDADFEIEGDCFVTKSEASSRVKMNGLMNMTWWKVGDMISIFDTPFTIRPFKHKGNENAYGDFNGNCVSEDDYIAVYPHSSSYSYKEHSQIVSNIIVKHSYTTQWVKESSGYFCEPNAPITVGRCVDSRSTKLYNMLSTIAFIMPDNVKECSIYSNSGEAIAGDISVYVPSPKESDKTPQIVEISNPYTYITITDTKNGGLQAGEPYFFFLIPGQLQTGFTMVFHLKDDTYKYYSITKDVRNGVAYPVDLRRSVRYNLNDKVKNGLSWTPALVNMGTSAGTFFNIDIQSLAPGIKGATHAWGDPNITTKWSVRDYIWSDKSITATMTEELWEGTQYKYLDKSCTKCKSKNYTADGVLTMSTTHDAAYQALNGKGVGTWRIPTKAQWQALINVTDIDMVENLDGGVKYFIISKETGAKMMVSTNLNYTEAAYYCRETDGIDALATDGKHYEVESPCFLIGDNVSTVYNPSSVNIVSFNRATILPIRPRKQ